MKTSRRIDAILIFIAVMLLALTALVYAQSPSPSDEAIPQITAPQTKEALPQVKPTPERSQAANPVAEKTVYQQVDKLIPGPTKTVVVEKPGPTITIAPAIKDQKVDLNSGFNTSLPTAEKQREIRIVQAEIYGHETIVVPQKKAETTASPSTATQKTETKSESSEKDLAKGVGLFWAKVLEWVTRGIVWFLATLAIIGMIILLIWGLILAITAIINALRGGNAPAEPAVPAPAAAAVIPAPAGPAAPPAVGGPMPEPPAPPVV